MISMAQPKMGVRSDPVATAVRAELTKLAGHVAPIGQVARGGAGYAIDGRLNDAFSAVTSVFQSTVAAAKLGSA